MSESLDYIPQTLDGAINKAAEHLPKGYVINIQIEHAGYTVDMSNPDGSTVDNVDGGDGIRSDINEAICIANGFIG